MESISQMIDRAVKEAKDELKNEYEKSKTSIMAEVAALKTENLELKTRITNMERAAEKNEQYNRKTSLILGGGGIPLPPNDHYETTSETRAIATKVIKEKLNINMQGAIVACHRLKNKKTGACEVSGHGGP